MFLTLDKGRWNIVYPIYLNNKKKISEGRQVPIARAIDRPNVYDIVDVCVALKLPHEVEVRDFQHSISHHHHHHPSIADDHLVQ